MADIRSFFRTSGSTASAKRPRVALQVGKERAGVVAQDPKRIITWNANGFMSRVSSPEDLAAFQCLVRTHDPDVICLQEARIKAHCGNPKAKVASEDPRDRARPLEAELQGPLRAALQSAPLADYDVFWSLANGRSAGTAMFVHQRLGHADLAVASCLKDALALCGSSDVPGRGSNHHPEGRVQYIRFGGVDLMNTYVPNNGWTGERHAERRRWDEEMEAFLRARSEATRRPLVWCGDMNVAHRSEDSTDEEFFRAEWDRDSKRFSSKEAYLEATPPDDRGIPGFSDNERRRFEQL
eukprot:CAMPEP_0179191770 /NCGR_PEP_ID=MMETSP0796-20121207/95258_1 /TAXON_ID=73915 /ORGANISM="Pyrodinium bahamense, Strain pbaha01" /LENGTH=295 /DNA_ID=CAMNT_0020896005 /DNA_START=45 /DNA_END=928 /DNA_ORIENTATION=-